MTEPLIVPEVSATTRALIDMLIQRDQHGRAKYGTTLDRTDIAYVEQYPDSEKWRCKDCGAPVYVAAQQGGEVQG